MVDRREQILQRLGVIFSEVPGINKIARNAQDITGRSEPAIVMHDASESSSDLSNRPPHFTPKDQMVLSPQIFILLGDRSTIVGTRVSDFRNSLVKLIWTDSQLRDLCGHNGDIRYMGCALNTETGETREARLEVNFEFTYMLDCAEL